MQVSDETVPGFGVILLLKLKCQLVKLNSSDLEKTSKIAELARTA
jgi:hypothetical protein